MGASYRARAGLGALLGVVVIAGVSCRAAPPPCRCPSTVATPVAVDEPVTPVVADTPPPVAAPARGTLCWAKGRPAAVAMADAATAATAMAATAGDDAPPKACTAFDHRYFTTVETDVRKAFVVTSSPSRLVVDFGCDVAGARLAEVILEDGSGHGGTLRVTRFTLAATDKVEVRVIDSSAYHRAGLELLSGTIDRKAFDKVIARSRIALMARPNLIPLTDPRGLGSGSATGSSNDFHLRLTLVDVDGDTTDRHYSGYEGTLRQAEIIPMREATGPILALLEKATLTASEATDEDRAFFTARFRATMAAKPYWWVGERYVANAAALATIDAVPALLETLRAPAGASEDRTRLAALDAIASITGWDPRTAPSGDKRKVDDAVAAALEECALTP